MTTTSTTTSVTTSANPWKAWGMALAPAMLLFILPFPGTVALRLLLLSISLVVAAVVWKRLAPPPLPCKWPLIIWAVVALASVPASFDPSYSMGEVKNEVGYSMMALVAFYVLASNQVQVRRIAAGLVAGILVMLGGAFLMQVGGQVTVTHAGQRLWNEGTFIGGSGVYATYLLTALPLLLAALLAGKRIMAAAAVFCAILVAGYFTGQKIFIVVAALQLALLLWLLGRGGLIRINRKWAWVMAAMAVVVLGAMLQQILTSRAMTDNPLRDNIVRDVRLRQWPLIMERVMEHPLTGAGFGRNAMRQAYPDLLTKDVPLFWHAHNVFLNYGISMGVPGMLALLLVFGSLLRAFWMLAGSGSATQCAIGAAGFAMVTGVILRNLTNDFFMRDMSLLFWALTGLLLGLGRRLTRDGTGDGTGDGTRGATGDGTRGATGDGTRGATGDGHGPGATRRHRDNAGMKICFYNVTASYIHGGLETYCWEAGRALARRGHSVTIVAGNDGAARHNEVSLVQFPFIREKSWPDFGTRFRRLMERLSFARHSLGHLVSEGYDAVIVNKPFDFPILWRARGLGLRAQTVFRSGGKDFYAGDRYFAGAIDHWLSTSHYNALQVQKRYGRKVGVIYNGVDIDEFRPLARSGEFRSRFGIGPGEIMLVSIGRLVGLKGLRVVIEALKDVRAAHFVIAGDGPEQGRLQQQARDLGLAGRVHFAGRVPHDRLPVLLADADAFVQPSIGEESFGISIVEAMACGLPVLASRLGGMIEIIHDQAGAKQTGELLPPGDVAAWTAAIRHLATDAGYRQRLGTAGRIRADQNFTWAANALKLEQLLTGQWSPLVEGLDDSEIEQAPGESADKPSVAE